MNSWHIANHLLGFQEETHTYYVDGVKVPSVTQMLKVRFGHKYDGVPADELKKAAVQGIELHRAVENYCTTGQESDLIEVKNFKRLQHDQDFRVIGNEIPVILFHTGQPIAAGRLDMLIEWKGLIGIADIKRTPQLDVDYLTYQLNLYRLAYWQSYETYISILRGIQLHEDIAKLERIQVDEHLAWSLVHEYRRFMKNGEENTSGIQT